MSRYAAQMGLPQVGSAGQRRLAGARVLVVGAGGLGCALLPLLAGAGVGTLRILDPDRVERANLHRQTLYAEHDLGRSKATAAAERLCGLNRQIRIEAHPLALGPINAGAWVAGADLVIDAADAFAVTYVLSDVCQRLGRPLISASAQQLQGYVGSFCGGAPSYRAVFPQPAGSGACGDTGVLGPVVAVLGALQAQMALALLLQLDPSPRGHLLRWDAVAMRLARLDFRDAPEPTFAPPFLAPGQLADGDLVIDLRDVREAPLPVRSDAWRLPPAETATWMGRLPTAGRLVLCCRTGVRAARVAAHLHGHGYRQVALMATA